MYLFWYVLSRVLSLAFDALLVLFFIRAVFSWISPEPTNRFTAFVYTVVELIVSPVRKVLSRFRFVRECPIDLSFTATLILITAVRTILGL